LAEQEKLVDGQTWVLVHRERPWTLNNERKLHFYERANLVVRYRRDFAILAKEAKIPALEWCRIEAIPHLLNGRGMQDTAGCFPAVKAAIDGLVDARVIPDDGPDHVVHIGFGRPVLGENALVIEVTGPIKEAS
jgi:hypothetical protein